MDEGLKRIHVQVPFDFKIVYLQAGLVAAEKHSWCKFQDYSTQYTCVQSLLKYSHGNLHWARGAMPSCQTPSDPAINLSSLSGKHFPAGEILPKAELISLTEIVLFFFAEAKQTVWCRFFIYFIFYNARFSFRYVMWSWITETHRGLLSCSVISFLFFQSWSLLLREQLNITVVWHCFHIF